MSPKYSPIKKYPVVAQKCNQWSGFSIEKAQFIEPNSLSSYGPERLLQDNDLMWNSTGLGTLGRMAIYKTAANPYELAVADSHVTVIRPLKQFVLPEYLYYYFANPSVQSVIEDQADGTTKQKELATATIKAYLTPIPPLDEQRRILAKLSEVLPVVKNYGVVYDETTAMQEAFPESLKKSILQEAVQGKLVPQDPSDEPAEALLERIRAEKQRLIKEGKIKKDKHESVIFRRDNSHYEKLDGVERCIDDELLFEIPDSWEWVRLGTVLEIARGGSPRPIQQYLTTEPDGINWIKIGDTDKGGKYIYKTKEKIRPEGVAKSRMVHSGDFLLTNSMSFGRPYILKSDGCIHDGWLVLSNRFECYSVDFLYYILSSPFAYYQFCDSVSGAVVKNLNSDKVANALFPLPPLSEQKRIVQRIEELLPLVKGL